MSTVPSLAISGCFSSSRSHHSFARRVCSLSGPSSHWSPELSPVTQPMNGSGRSNKQPAFESPPDENNLALIRQLVELLLFLRAEAASYDLNTTVIERPSCPSQLFPEFLRCGIAEALEALAETVVVRIRLNPETNVFFGRIGDEGATAGTKQPWRSAAWELRNIFP